MNRYSSVFSTQDPQSNRNQFESQVYTKPVIQIETITPQSTSAISSPPIDSDLVLKFLEAVSKDPVNLEKSSDEKLRIAIEMVRQLTTF
jgi:hypothetical protein